MNIIQIENDLQRVSAQELWCFYGRLRLLDIVISTNLSTKTSFISDGKLSCKIHRYIYVLAREK